MDQSNYEAIGLSILNCSQLTPTNTLKIGALSPGERSSPPPTTIQNTLVYLSPGELRSPPPSSYHVQNTSCLAREKPKVLRTWVGLLGRPNDAT